MTAVFIILFVLFVNTTAFIYFGAKTMADGKSKLLFSRDKLEAIGQEMYLEDGKAKLSKKGTELLEDSAFIWAMRLSKEGKVEWSYKLPEELNRQYDLTDVAVFSRWYLEDYPVYVWKDGDALMVYGCEKDSIARMSTIYSVAALKQLPRTAAAVVILNLILIVGLALAFGYRFYRALRPIAGGIERLSKKEEVSLPEKGLTAELAEKLNQTSELLKQQDEKLWQRDHARTNWIAGVSHDIRTPLALITGYSDELLNDASLGEEVRKKTELIQSQSLLIKQLIEDLNLTSKLEYQAQPLHKGFVSPAGLLRSCVAEYYNQGILPQFEIEVRIDETIEKRQIEADSGLLLRAFRNLIGNSIRHNPEGCMMAVTLNDTGEGAKFLFSDTGSGIPEKVRRVLLEEKTEQEAAVHVMGLRIVKQIVMAHGGKMSFEDGGRQVILVLPYAEEENHIAK